MTTAASTRHHQSFGARRLSDVVILDCEFLSAEGAPRRFWCGPTDPDPTVVQIGAVRLGLGGDHPLGQRFQRLIHPVDRSGAPVTLDPAFCALTGLTNQRLADEGQSLAQALADFAAFARGRTIWSWGKDELNLMAISSYVAGIRAPIPARRFGNACALLLAAGVPLSDIQTLRSHTLCTHFGLTPPQGRAHDALFDALSLATVLRHLLLTARLAPTDFQIATP